MGHRLALAGIHGARDVEELQRGGSLGGGGHGLRKCEERYSFGDGAVWETWPHNLALVGAVAARDEATRHDWRFKNAYRVDYVWTSRTAITGGYEANFDD